MDLITSQITWTTYAVANTLINVGSEAVCTACDNILCFMDLKTKAMKYYKAESPTQGLSMSVITGHNRFPLVAFAEVVLRPSVHILEYPGMTKYAVFASDDIVTFVDIRFNEFDILVAVSGYPNYSICVWNFRTGQLMLQHDTRQESIARSLLLSSHHIPQITQYSEWNKNLDIWEICYASTGVDLHKVSRMTLEKEYGLSNILSMCYGEDNNLYIVDNYGAVSLVHIAQFNAIPQWSLEDFPQYSNVPKQFFLCSYKQGLLVYCPEFIYCVRRKGNQWIVDWYLTDVLPGGICKIIFIGDIFVNNPIGNIYQVEVKTEAKVEVKGDEVTIQKVYGYNTKCIDFAVLKTTRDECMVQLTAAGILRAVELGAIRVFSEFEIPNAIVIASHNAKAFLVVGTTCGNLHCIDYQNIREPKEVGFIETTNGFGVAGVQFMADLILYRNIYFDYYLVEADINKSKFCEVAPVVHIPEEVNVHQQFLGDNNAIYLFLNRDRNQQIPHTTELWSFQWNPDANEMSRQDYYLLYTYRDVTIMRVPKRDGVEFVGARLHSTVIDILHLITSSRELILVSSVHTNHLTNINGIVGSRHLLTWALDGTYIHYRSHKKSTRPYAISQVLQIKYLARVVKRVLDCFNTKYLVFFYSSGGVKVMKVSVANAPMWENTFLSEETESISIAQHHSSVKKITCMTTETVIEYTPEEIRERDDLLDEIEIFGGEVSALINYDIGVTGKTHGVYKKFCLNETWLTSLTAEVNKLCALESKSLEAAIADQSRVRDWIRRLILACSENISYKLRALFSNFSFENYGKRRGNDEFSSLYYLFWFYDLVAEEEQEEGSDEDSKDNEAGGDRTSRQLQPRKFLKIRGSVFEHVLANELALQDVDTVTANQMYNLDSKIRLLLTDLLKEEFNKKFDEIRQIKFDLMDAILGTNTSLENIYDNMNCMLRLLKEPTFIPPELSVPLWEDDEFVERIMEVDDSEITAVNRRKKKAEMKAVKHGRLLLWSLEFWARSLIVMMDGVLEKLWEEEIKKNIPIPEFMQKKEPSEYTLEDQKMLKDYEERVLLLTEDRKKYLIILAERDEKVNEMKTNYILKLNDQVTRMMITKLQYDFCVKHARLRNLNVKLMNYNKLQWLKLISAMGADIEKVGVYIGRYTKLADYWTYSVDDLRGKIENISLRERAIDRQFKSHFLNAIPQHMGPEMTKAYKRRPKLSPKILQSTLICKELSMRVNTKAPPKYPFPLPKDVFDYLDGITALDEPAMMPNTMDPRHWDLFVRLRRQKMEVELKIKAVSLLLTDTIHGMNYYHKELQNLKNTKIETHRIMQETQGEYLKSICNQTLELRLTMGQVELNVMGSLTILQRCILMHVDDINDINSLILRVGQMKIKAMQRVAFFRRQVIFREWEHKVVSANIEYLKFMLHVIGKCKVSMEFLSLLRNWSKVRADKTRLLNTVGLIERAIEEKQFSYRRQLERLNTKISGVRQQIDDMKQENKVINRQIENVKVEVAFSNTNRDTLIEDKRRREQNEKMEKLKKHRILMDSVRQDYAHIMELKTILELQRLRTYPTLGPNPDQCLK